MAEMAPAGHGAYFINSGGQTVRVSTEAIPQAQQLGWVPASEGQVKDLLTQEKFGTPGQQVKTGAEALGDVLTFGLSTQAETKLGVPAEDIAGREEANPGIHAAATGAGILVPALLTGTASLEANALRTAGRAAEFTAPELIGGAGRAVAKGVERILPKATSTAGKIATKAIATGAGGATEGAFYGLGHVIHEDALGDPNLTASSAWEEIGMAGLMGAGIGGTGGALGQMAHEAAGGKLGQKLAEWLPEFEGERNIKAAGGIQSDIKGQLKKMSREELNKIAREAGDLGLVGGFSTPGKTLERSEQLMDSSGSKMGDILEQADAQGAAPATVERVAGRIRKEVVSGLEENPFQAPTAKKLGDILSSYEEKFTETGGPGLGFRDLHNIRQEMDKEIFGLRGQLDPGATYYRSALREARGIVSDEINKGLESAGLDSAAWKTANRQYQVAATISKFAEKGLERLHGNNLVSPTELLSMLAGGIMHGAPGGLALGLATAAARRYGSGLLATGARGLRRFLEKDAAEVAAGKTAELIAAERKAGSDTIAQGASYMPESVAALSQLERSNAQVAKRIDAAMASVVEASGKVARGLLAKAAAVQAEHLTTDEKIDHVNRLALNPELMQQRLLTQTGDVHEHAPKTAQALMMTSARAMSFLHAKAPKMPSLGPLGPKLKPTHEQTWKFNRYFNAVQKPTHILHHAAAGTLTPMDVEAVATVHPALYEKMKASAMEQMVAKEGTVAYRARLMLSMLVGQSLDGSMTPESIMANQATFMMPSSKSGQDVAAPRSNQSGLAKLDGFAEQSMLPGQGAEARRREV